MRIPRASVGGTRGFPTLRRTPLPGVGSRIRSPEKFRSPLNDALVFSRVRHDFAVGTAKPLDAEPQLRRRTVCRGGFLVANRALPAEEIAFNWQPRLKDGLPVSVYGVPEIKLSMQESNVGQRSQPRKP
jgi:hypothetical protein